MQRPRRRFVDPSIWEDPDVSRLSDAEFRLFVGCFSNADDEGRLFGDPEFLFARIFTRSGKTVDEVKTIRDAVVKKCPNLILYNHGNQEYLCFLKWQKYQKPRYPKPSTLPPPPEKHQKDEGLQPVGNQKDEGLQPVGNPRLGVGLGVGLEKESLILSPQLAAVEVKSTKNKLKPHQQEAGVFLDMVEKEEGVKLLSRARLVNLVRTKLFQIAETTPEKLMEFYRWLKLNEPFFRNKAPPQIIGGMVDRYPSWVQGKLKGSPTRRVEPRTRLDDFKGDQW